MGLRAATWYAVFGWRDLGLLNTDLSPTVGYTAFKFGRSELRDSDVSGRGVEGRCGRDIECEGLQVPARPPAGMAGVVAGWKCAYDEFLECAAGSLGCTGCSSDALHIHERNQEPALPGMEPIKSTETNFIGISDQERNLLPAINWVK